MPYLLDDRLVGGIASSALFDLAESDRVFRSDGEEAYRRYQEDHLEDPLQPGIAFSFIRRLLSLNDLVDEDDPLVEVIVMSRRAPAGRVLPSATVDDADDDLRIAFDFDGVLADDKSEQVMQECGLPQFHEHELAHAVSAHDPGPLQPFLVKVAKIQAAERERKRVEPDYRIRLHIALVTARNAPSHKRAIQSLKSWGVMVNDAFFLGGNRQGSRHQRAAAAHLLR